MTAKEYLQQYKDADRLAQRLKKEYEKELDLIDSLRSAANTDGMPRGGGRSKPTEIKAVKLADKMTEYQEAEYEAIRVKRRVLKTINMIQGECGEVLYERYINFKSWSEVAEAVGYTKRHCFNLHLEALDQVEKILRR